MSTIAGELPLGGGLVPGPRARRWTRLARADRHPFAPAPQPDFVYKALSLQDGSVLGRLPEILRKPTRIRARGDLPVDSLSVPIEPACGVVREHHTEYDRAPANGNAP